MEIAIGSIGRASDTVSNANTASAVGSGQLKVYATPAMIALMEKAACNCLAGQLPEGISSVGTKIDISHISATPVGSDVRAEAELVEVDRRRLVFRCSAYDCAGLIGEGTQERFLVDNAKFSAKAQSKLCQG